MSKRNSRENKATRRQERAETREEKRERLIGSRPGAEIEADPEAMAFLAEGAFALYHVMYATECFGDAAEALFTIVRDCARKFPGGKRRLYFDIEGHRKPGGGWDADADSLLAYFVPEVLGMWLTRYNDADGNEVINPDPGDNVPDGLILASKDGSSGPQLIGLDPDGEQESKTVAIVMLRAGVRLRQNIEMPDDHDNGSGDST
jgi:hypothetical protein